MDSRNRFRNFQQELTQILKNAGIEQPERQVLSLMGHVTGKPLIHLLTGDVSLSPDSITRLRELVTRRASGEPLQYLVGTAPFWKHTFRVAPGVLIPRPETEHILELFLDETRPGFTGTVVDCGTGSGNIAISAALERPHARILATDRSTAALAVAEQNRNQLGGSNMSLIHGDMLKSIGRKTVDMVLSNPPYIDPADRGSLQPELDHEPEQALFSSPDGLTHIRRLITDSSRILKKSGLLIFEFGYNQGQAIRDIVSEQSFDCELCITRDLRGVERIGRIEFH